MSTIRLNAGTASLKPDENPDDSMQLLLASILVVSIRAIPFLAVLLVLSPYLWPFDYGPTSSFNDIAAFHAPNVEMMSSSLWVDGELPRWNHLDFGGVPTLSDPQVGLYNPVYWLMALRPSLHSFGLLIIGYALAGALGMLLYIRKLGGSLLAAACAAIVFALGGKVLMHLVVNGHTIIAPFYLLPMTLFVIENMVRSPSLPRIAIVASLLGWLALSTHPQFLLYVVYATIAASAIAAAHSEDRGRALGALVVAAVLGAGVAAILWLPVLDNTDEYSRGMPGFADMGYWDAHYAMVKSRALELIVGSRKMSGESHYFLGGATLWWVSISLATWRRGHRLGRLFVFPFWMTIVTLLVGLDFPMGPLAPLVGDGIFRIPDRALVLLGFSSACLVAFGVDRLVEVKGRALYTTGVFATLGTAVLLAVGGATSIHWFGLLIAVFGGMLLAGRTHREVARPAQAWIGSALVLIALAADTGIHVRSQIATAPEAEITRPEAGFSMPKDRELVERIAEPTRHIVSRGIPEVFKYREKLESLTGYNPLIPWRFIQYMGYAGGMTYANFHDEMYTRVARRQLFDLFCVTHYLEAKRDGEGPWRWRELGTALPRAYFVPNPVWVGVVTDDRDKQGMVDAEHTALVRLNSIDPRREVLLHQDEPVSQSIESELMSHPREPFRPVAITSRTANHMVLEFSTERPAILVVSEPYFPGWRAWDGERELPVMRANVLFRALAVDSGVHRVRFEFRPQSWVLGRGLSMASLLAILVLFLSGLRRSRRPARL